MRARDAAVGKVPGGTKAPRSILVALKCEELFGIADFEVAPSFLWFAAVQGIEGEERLADLAPEGCFIAAEAVERAMGRLARRKKQRASSTV